MSETEKLYPACIFFFPNGMTAVTDQHGNQMPKYQDRHAVSIETLKADGINWAEIPECHGIPTRPL